MSDQKFRIRVPVVWRFPLIVVLLVLGLGAFGVSGSSVGTYGAATGNDGVLAGKARIVRTDEYWIRAPLVARAVERGFPSRDEVGVGATDMGVLSQLPTNGLGVVLLPYTIPYHVLPLDNAFAVEWWLLFLALPALGTYAFLLALRVRTGIAIAASLVFVFSPAMQWWTMPPSGGTVGFATLAGATLLYACRARSWPRRLAFAGTAGWLGACLVAVLYPPWLIPIVLLVGAAAAGSLVSDVKRLPPAWNRIGLVAAACTVAGGVAAVLLTAFVIDHREALRAVASTVYPGQRRERGGSGSGATFFVAQFDILQSARSASLVNVNGGTHFEAAGLPLLLVVGAGLVVGPYQVLIRRWRDHLALGCVLAVGAVLSAWYILPVPRIMGALVGLDRVPPVRLAFPLAFAGVLALALFVEARRRTAVVSPWSSAAGASVFVFGALWQGRHLEIEGAAVPQWTIVLIVALFATAIALALYPRFAGLVAIAVLLGIAASFVNPLQHGLGVLVDSPSAKLGRTLKDRQGVDRVLMFADDPGPRVIDTRAGLTASGVNLLSGVNLYPDRDAWTILDPDGRYEDAWNRFNNASWGIAEPGAAPRVELDAEDAILVFVDPCDSRLRRLHVTTVVSLKPIEAECLVKTDRVRDGSGKSLHVYAINRP